MIDLLAKLFIKDYQKLSDPAVRRAYGSLCCIVGICLNILLFAGKYFAGLLSGSIAITADAFNNLSDAGSSLVTLVGFRLGGKKPDPEHPFGHGRLEYMMTMDILKEYLNYFISACSGLNDQEMTAAMLQM